MRRRTMGFGVAALAALVARHATAGGGPDLAKMGAAVRSFMAGQTIGATHVTVFRGDQTLLERGYGSASPGSGPPDSRSVFPIGSISKHFTAAAIVALADQGKVRLDAPLPPDEPAAPNPPDGTAIDYHLRADAKHVTLEVLDAQGRLVRRAASDDRPVPPVEGRNIPDYWIRPPQKLSTEAGLHRFVWDLRHETPAASSFGYPMAAIALDTPREPRGPWVVPGTYTVRLTADGHVLAQPLAVGMDPRVKTPLADIEAQHAISMRLCDAMGRAHAALGEGKKPAEGEDVGRLRRLHGQLTQLLDTVEDVDALPTPAVQKAVDEAIAAIDAPRARGGRLP